MPVKIVVCLKQVPDSTLVKVDPKTGTLMRAGVPSILNPYDHFALESALKIKAKTGGEVCVISMGPPQAASVVRLALALGADKGILLTDKAFAGSDTWATAYALSKAIKKTGRPDLILCGMMAIDGDTAQTGPGIAQQLRLPQITFCRSVEIVSGKLYAEKLVEGGHEVVEAAFPVLCTLVFPQDYTPAFPSLKQIFSAQQKPFETWTAADIAAEEKFIGLAGSPTRVDRVYAPSPRAKGAVYEGTPAELAEKLLQILAEENFVK